MSGVRAHRRLLLGDWSPVVRDAIDVLRATFLVAAIALLLAGEIGAGVRMGLTFLLLAGLRLLDLPRPVDLGVVLGMALQAWGNALGLFDRWPWWDVVVHFVLPLFTAPALYIMLARLEVVPDLTDPTTGRNHVGILIITAALGVSVGVVYELYEWFDVRVFGAGLHVGYGDTIADLLDDMLASVAGGALLVWWATRGWATTRRLPERRAPHR
jgi:hypothetical protein